MKKNTSKYLAAIIIVLGLLFIYLIPNCHGSPEEEYRQSFNNARSVLLIENIQLDNNGSMNGHITAMYGDSPNKIGDKKSLGELGCCPGCGGKVTCPDGAVILINKNNDEEKFYINDGILSVNGLTKETVKNIINNKNK